jgi:hypothetical protein
VGVAAATVFQYIRWWCLHHGQCTDTYDRMLEVFPYLSRKRLQLIIFKLTEDKEFEPLLIRKRVPGKNQFKYLLVDAKIKLKKPHSFDPQFALKYDVNMAVIYDDLVKWIAKNDETGDGEQPTHYESPAQWVRAHRYMPLRTVERCFAKLAKAGEIIEIGRTSPENAPIWTIPLGKGKLDRWYALHRPSKQKHQKEAITAVKYVYMPVLHDPDLDSIDGAKPKPLTEAVEDCGFWHHQNPKKPNPQKPREKSSAKTSPPSAKR